jgi:ubiquinone/menaquinone biosynthesis C-methylase UbiE
VSGTDRAYQELGIDQMTTVTRSDNWFIKRIMKLTCFEKWLINSPRHAQHTERTALALLEHISLSPRPHCLEIGCGQGALARLLVERYGAQVVASDYDPAQVALAQERLADLGEQVEFRVVDARAIPFDDAEFDAVFSFGVLHHIPGGWRQAVSEIARVLRSPEPACTERSRRAEGKPGGWFVFTDLVISPRAGRMVRRLLPRFDQLEEAALQECLTENGLDLEHYAYARGEFMAVLRLMNYCTAVAHKK